ncbi:MAG: hypothetical protein ACRBB0_12085 [Pelagimonas sp.]|uniref:hypothetical protein n=1 Tax=Pelagimonas sp. TaxID=2073170 RepID=UPI003D6A4A6E
MKDHIIRIGIAFAICAVIVGGAQTLPALTEPTHSVAEIMKSSRQNNFRPMHYCNSALSGVDCNCFAQKAAQVLVDKRTRIWGWEYTNKLDLAIDQGRKACS